MIYVYKYENLYNEQLTNWTSGYNGARSNLYMLLSLPLKGKRERLRGKALFVKEVCAALRLPYLEASTRDDGVGTTPSPPKKMRTFEWDIASISIPFPLARENLWKRDLPKLQLELVVGNHVLANIVNGTMAAKN